MPRRTTTAELRDRLDGLGVAMFAIIGALVDSLAEVHPDSDDLWERLPAKAIGLVMTLEGAEQDLISLEAIDSAFEAIAAAFAGRREASGVEPEGDNDNERG